MWWEYQSGMGWWMLWEGILVVLLAAVIGLAAWAALAWRPRNERRERTALAAAEQRYARGDIARDEFERVRRDLHRAA